MVLLLMVDALAPVGPNSAMPPPVWAPLPTAWLLKIWVLEMERGTVEPTQMPPPASVATLFWIVLLVMVTVPVVPPIMLENSAPPPSELAARMGLLLRLTLVRVMFPVPLVPASQSKAPPNWSVALEPNCTVMFDSSVSNEAREPLGLMENTLSMPLLALVPA